MQRDKLPVVGELLPAYFPLFAGFFLALAGGAAAPLVPAGRVFFASAQRLCCASAIRFLASALMVRRFARGFSGTTEETTFAVLPGCGGCVTPDSSSFAC